MSDASLKANADKALRENFDPETHKGRATEIVWFVQNHSEATQKCIDFAIHELTKTKKEGSNKAREEGIKQGRTITTEELEALCQVFHKHFRVITESGSFEVWRAINTLSDLTYGNAMQDSLEEIGISVVDKKLKGEDKRE